MKKRILKDWIAYTIIVVQVLLMCLVSGEYEVKDLSVEFAIKLPLFFLMIVNHFLIARHTNFYTGEF